MTINEPARFLLSGALATATQYGILWAGTSLAQLSAAVASGFGYLAGSVVAYIANYFYTFSSNRSHATAIGRFYLMVAVGWLITTLMMWALVDHAGWNKWFGQILATGTCLAWNYAASRTWVFSSD